MATARVESGLLSLLGFNGERPDPVTGCYLLGNGYRAFNPVLMRFNSPDSLSPFGKGGLNAYAYCSGDPVNLSDPSGHFPFQKSFLKLLTRRGTTVNRASPIYLNGAGKTFEKSTYMSGPTRTMREIKITNTMDDSGNWRKSAYDTNLHESVGDEYG